MDACLSEAVMLMPFPGALTVLHDCAAACAGGAGACGLPQLLQPCKLSCVLQHAVSVAAGAVAGTAKLRLAPSRVLAEEPEPDATQARSSSSAAAERHAVLLQLHSRARQGCGCIFPLQIVCAAGSSIAKQLGRLRFHKQLCTKGQLKLAAN